ncbi:large conductance mechanosensitive channel protein MscL [Cohnella thailandensis]|uniref:Large-conductance mechanosensitive channel n=1 Tax=Cohnella thailandensis TaxID=557557 RepID=A0A841T851_9BACL|nr:large conductance mechanosensitive channel protein MscL [Cohnella thailandensis]MBB6637351.1 large conductance mechanosensitive channel protein MscL [Cohnella thailandensis]MBP1976680.1 large conductance mechanosensitive channel [Cohnella thailandensis]
MIGNWLKEFKTFAMRGNVIDLAVGVIIGGAFGQIVTSLVNDIVMPPIGRLLGGADFKDLFIRIGPIPENPTGNITTLEGAKANAIPVIAYGQFINVLLNFLIVAFCIFFLIKVINTLSRKNKKEEEQAAAEAAPTTKDCPYCLSAIPVKATRCGHCTSILSDGQAETV